jgi:hypothetical protein
MLAVSCLVTRLECNYLVFRICFLSAILLDRIIVEFLVAGKCKDGISSSFRLFSLGTTPLGFARSWPRWRS